MGAFWRDAYETPDIEDQFEEVWQEMLPLYEQLHAYVRRYASSIYICFMSCKIVFTPLHFGCNSYCDTHIIKPKSSYLRFLQCYV